MPCKTCAVSENPSEGPFWTYHTHALPSGKEGGDTDEETKESESSPSTVCRAQGDDDAIDNTGHDSGDTKAASKCLSRWVAVADSPANEIGMGLVAEGPFHRGNNLTEGRRMSGDRKCFQEDSLLLGG